MLLKKKPRLILTINRSKKRLSYRREAIEVLFRFLDGRGTPAIPPGDLSIVFMSDEELAQLHGDFLNDPSPTDVITFPGDPTMELAGEICLSVDAAKRAAAEYSQPLAHELTLYLVHGWLHLAGYDDHRQEDRRLMEKMQTDLLNALEAAGKIPHIQLLS